MLFADNAGADQPMQMHRLTGPSLPAYRINDIVVCVDEQRMSRPGCTDALAHLDLRCSQMA